MEMVMVGAGWEKQEMEMVKQEMEMVKQEMEMRMETIGIGIVNNTQW